MESAARRVALVGANREVSADFRRFLGEAGYFVESVESVEHLRQALSREAFEVVFVVAEVEAVVKGRMVEAVSAVDGDVPVVVIARNAELPSLVELSRAGVSDALGLPFSREEALFAVQKALLRADHAEEQASASAGDVNLETESPGMKRALSLADRAARGTSTVLIRGESGVGKEVFAERIHARSARASGPFVKVHCAALPEQILESELFGYEKGAFTGAVARKPGRFELATGGTIFLDEIGDISPVVQVKLLRVLQDRTYERLGGTQSLSADVRVVAATHRNLERMLKTREFREDLYYRLNVLPIEVPPLRARPDHVAALARHFCRHFAEVAQRTVTLSEAAQKALMAASWPGNVRQLQNMIERLVVLTESSTIDANDVAVEFEREGSMGQEDASAELSTIELSRVVQKAERRALLRALERSAGNRAMAARLLGVSKRTLFYKLREHQL